MFVDSILETSWTERTHRSWTTLTSFGLQVVVISLLLLLPLLKTVGLPSGRTISTPISLGRRNAEPPAPTPRGGITSAPQTNFVGIRFMQPSRIPTVITAGSDEPSAPAPSVVGTGIPVGAEAGLDAGMSLIGGTRPVMPTPVRPLSVPTFRTSKMLEGNLIRRVQPVYPPLARNARIQGPVVLAAVISKAGTMENLRVLSGHPMLVAAAIDAVSEWRYRPYILNSEPIEVETQITVNFMLSGN